MFLNVEWYVWLLGIFAILCIAMLGGWIRGAIRDSRQERIAEESGLGGADMAWAEKVHAISIDEKLETTGEIDMSELHMRLDLDAVEDGIKKQAYRIIDEAVTTLLDDDEWSKYLIKRKEVQNV